MALVIGWCSLTLPVLLTDHVQYPATASSFFPFMRDVVEGITPTSLACLFAANATVGMFARTPPFVLGPTSVVAFPTWSAIDMAMGGDHNLFPFEWAIYGFYAVVATVGEMSGWLIGWIRRRRRAHDDPLKLVRSDQEARR